MRKPEKVSAQFQGALTTSFGAVNVAQEVCRLTMDLPGCPGTLVVNCYGVGGNTAGSSVFATYLKVLHPSVLDARTGDVAASVQVASKYIPIQQTGSWSIPYGVTIAVIITEFAVGSTDMDAQVQMSGYFYPAN